MNLPAELGTAPLHTHPNAVWEYRFLDSNGKAYAHVYVQTAPGNEYRVRLIDHEIMSESDRPYTYFDETVSETALDVALQCAYTKLVSHIETELSRHRHSLDLYTKLVNREEDRLALLNEAPTLWERLA